MTNMKFAVEQFSIALKEEINIELDDVIYNRLLKRFTEVEKINIRLAYVQGYTDADLNNPYNSLEYIKNNYNIEI